MQRHFLALLLLAGALLATDCDPSLPELDPVISTSPEAVKRLRERHGDFLVMKEDADNERPVVFVPGGRIFTHLEQIDVAVDGMEALQGARLRGGEDRARCGDGNPSTLVFELDLTLKRRWRRSRAETWTVSFCEAATVQMPWTPTPFFGTEPPRGVALGRLTTVLQGAYALLLEDWEGYQEDFEREQHAILAGLLGCPEGTRYAHSERPLAGRDQPTQHWCDRGGVRHGPFVEGRLGPLLDGVRSVEGAYVDGARDGHWRLRDAEGELLEESWWDAGTRRDAEPDR